MQKSSDGSFDDPSYIVYDLPDPGTLGSATMVGTCDVAPNTCVIGIFAENPGTTGFNYPHLFSAPFNIEVGDGLDDGANPGDGTAPTSTPPATTSLSTSLSGGGQSGTSISVPTGTAVTDTATLSGTNAATATGTVTYNVYTDSGCTTLASGGGGTAETISTPGTLPASSPVTLSSAGTYYWGVSYSGDTNNATSTSTCGTAGEVATVTSTSTPPATTSLSTSLSGGGQSGTSISVPTGTAVTDTATLSGTNAARRPPREPSPTTSTPTRAAPRWPPAVEGSLRPSRRRGRCPPPSPVTLSSAGTYYWGVSYSGDTTTPPLDEHLRHRPGSRHGHRSTSTPPATDFPCRTSLSGGGQSGTSISVPTGTAVTDTATLSGTNAPTATGAVTLQRLHRLGLHHAGLRRWRAPLRPSRHRGRCRLLRRSP